MGNYDLDSVIDGVYAAADDPEGFAPALKKLGELLDAHANHTLIIPTATGIPENHHFGGDASSFVEYARDWKERDPRFGFALQKPGAVFSDVMVLDPSEFERSAIYNEHLSKHDVRYTLFGTFQAAPDLIVGSAFMRPKQASAFDVEEIQRMKAVVPHLTRAVRLRHVVTSLRNELADLKRALDAIFLPVLVLDEKAAIVCANLGAEELLRTRDGILVENGRLSATSLAARHAIDKAIAKATHDADCRASRPGRAQLLPPVKITRRDGAAISLAFLSLRPRNEIRERATPRARVLVLVHDPSRIVRVDRAAVAELHGLTATEAELAASLAEGKTLAEFAAARGSTEQTARTHLKRILDKTETRRQADLVRVLLTGVAVQRLR